MKTPMKKFTTLLLSGMFVFTLAACTDGPAEEAAEELGQIAEDAGNAVEDACEDVKEGVEAKDDDC